MWQSGRKAISHARTSWKEALQHSGATQMGYMRKLFESRPWQQLVPDQTIIMGENEEGVQHIRAARAQDGSFLIAYIPTGRKITIQANELSGKTIKAWWFDPRTGKATLIGQFKKIKQGHEFDPPGKEETGNDWVLLVENTNAKFPAPGKPLQ
jgi:hypothetical protein